MERIRLGIKVEGLVQGVGFRWFVVDYAYFAGVVGTVCNKADTSVYIEAQGTKSELAQFIEAVKLGPPLSRARVDNITTNSLELVDGEENMRITYPQEPCPNCGTPVEHTIEHDGKIMCYHCTRKEVVSAWQ